MRESGCTDAPIHFYGEGQFWWKLYMSYSLHRGNILALYISIIRASPMKMDYKRTANINIMELSVVSGSITKFCYGTLWFLCMSLCPLGILLFPSQNVHWNVSSADEKKLLVVHWFLLAGLHNSRNNAASCVQEDIGSGTALLTCDRQHWSH